MSIFSLKEVSELLQIPKSTLRYWEKENLIRSQRDQSNDYRTYSVEDLVIILDIMFYRNLNISVHSLKNIYQLSIPEHIDLLQKNNQEIDDKINELIAIKENIHKRITNLEKCQNFIHDKFDYFEPPFIEIHSMTLKSKENVFTYVNDQNLLSVVFKPLDNAIHKFGLLSYTENEKADVLWRKDPTAIYIPCIAVLTEQVIMRDVIDKKIGFIEEKGMKVKQIVGHYLVSDQNSDYYQCWFEVSDKELK